MTGAHQALADSPQAWRRLAVSLLAMTVGSSGMYIVAVVLPEVQAEFGVARADASLPYTMLMLGFGVGGVLMGRIADRFGVSAALMLGGVGLGSGFVAAGMAGSLWSFTLAHGVLIGLLGCSASFAPLVADTSLWFVRRRGIAVAICASGNYVAGALWPPLVQMGVERFGWRSVYLALGALSVVALPLLALALRTRPPALAEAPPEGAGAGVPAPGVAGAAGPAPALAAAARPSPALAGTAGPSPGLAGALKPFGLSIGVAQGLLCAAGLACCVAMSMPQVHIVAYCGDLGYGAARGAQMLSLMLGFGIVSRLVSGVICDRIGGLRTLLLGSALQGFALLLFLPFDGLASLYVIAALFGLFQGGIVPSYAIIVREHFPAREAASRTGTVLMFTLLGMALGGWMSGKVFDLTGSYHAAFLNGIAFNLLNFAIAFTLLRRASRLGSVKGPRSAAAAHRVA